MLITNLHLFLLVFILEGVTVAGGCTRGSELDQFNCPYSFDIDDQGTIVIADYNNARIVIWKKDSIVGEILADENEDEKLNCPTVLLIDRKTNSLIISDFENRLMGHSMIIKHNVNLSLTTSCSMV